MSQKHVIPKPIEISRHQQPLARRFAIGDVHGCCATLKSMVETVLCLETNDALYLLGDYIDRGPGSKGVLDYLMQLNESGFNIQPILGNHEHMLLNATRSFESRNMWHWNGGATTLHDFGVKRPEDIPQKYIEFISLLPLIIVLDDYVLVHAGLHFGVPDPINETPEFFMLWEREYKVQQEKLGGRTLLCGHTKTPIFEIRESLHKPAICLDNGCWSKGEIGYGNLVALDLDSRELLVLKNCE